MNLHNIHEYIPKLQTNQLKATALPRICNPNNKSRSSTPKAYKLLGPPIESNIF